MPITTDSAAVAARTPAVQSAALGGASAGIAGNIPVAQSVAIQLNRPIDQSTTLAGGPRISVTVLPLDEDASESDPAGQATIIGGTIGTPAWSLDDDADGKYAIDEATGAITVDDTLTEGTDEIIVEVSGVTPAVPAKTVQIVVAAGEEE